MFVKVDEKNNILKYPYSLANLRMDFSNISFPSDVNDESINHLGVYRVQPSARPTYDGVISKLVDTVELINEQWVQVWITENVDIESAKANVRRRRNSLLAETDYMALADSTLTEEWAAYRQALREIPQQEGFPFEVEWPSKPS
jgi:argonaute-like protein implicated in RNA metabolism and viral defense